MGSNVTFQSRNVLSKKFMTKGGCMQRACWWLGGAWRVPWQRAVAWLVVIGRNDDGAFLVCALTGLPFAVQLAFEHTHTPRPHLHTHFDR